MTKFWISSLDNVFCVRVDKNRMIHIQFEALSKKI